MPGILGPGCCCGESEPCPSPPTLFFFRFSGDGYIIRPSVIASAEFDIRVYRDDLLVLEIQGSGLSGVSYTTPGTYRIEAQAAGREDCELYTATCILYENFPGPGGCDALDVSRADEVQTAVPFFDLQSNKIFTISGGTGPLAAFNGTYSTPCGDSLPEIGPIQWVESGTDLPYGAAIVQYGISGLPGFFVRTAHNDSAWPNSSFPTSAVDAFGQFIAAKRFCTSGFFETTPNSINYKKQALSCFDIFTDHLAFELVPNGIVQSGSYVNSCSSNTGFSGSTTDYDATQLTISIG